MTKQFAYAPLLIASMFLVSCGPVPQFMVRSIERWSEPVQRVEHADKGRVFDEDGLSIHWVGHASLVIQFYDKVIVTDPNFSKTVGMLSRRMVEPGLDPARLTKVDFTIISHLHFDHFTFGSVDMLPKHGRLLIPLGGAEYTPDFGFTETREMKPWESIEEDGLRITAVPVQHFGGRYGFDILWMRDRGYTGYVLEYRGRTVFFGGDMGYHPTLYKELGKRYAIDVALLPIAPIEPRDFMKPVHVDPLEALQVMEDTGARLMIPMHHGTYHQGLEPSLRYARDILDSLIVSKGLEGRVKILSIGERWTEARPDPSPVSGTR